MSTSHTSEKTHQQMLPQSADAQSASADNLQGKDETGRGRRGNPATVVQHGRAETVGDPLSLQRHSLKPEQSSGDADRGFAAPPVITAQRVFVVDRHGHPLTPCHPARPRGPLHAERARVRRLFPFVIRLVDRAVEQETWPAARVGLSLPMPKGGGFSSHTHF